MVRQYRTKMRIAGRRAQLFRSFAGCCAVLWLAGSLSAAQENLIGRWTGSHCPQGHTQSQQHSPNHCVWHCGGIGDQASSERGRASVSIHAGYIWSFGAVVLHAAVFHAEIVPRGPPPIQSVVWMMSCQETGSAPRYESDN